MLEKQKFLLDAGNPDFKEDWLWHRGGTRLTDSPTVKIPYIYIDLTRVSSSTIHGITESWIFNLNHIEIYKAQINASDHTVIIRIYIYYDNHHNRSVLLLTYEFSTTTMIGDLLPDIS